MRGAISSAQRFALLRAPAKPGLAIILGLVLATAGLARADAPTAHWTAEESFHAGVPSELDLVVEGLDESPQPLPPALAIAGATVHSIGVQPNVSRMTQIINGRRNDFTRVTWVFRWSVTVAKPGRIRVPATTVAQGGQHVSAPAVEAEVDEIPPTDAMRLELSLPSRPVFVGENIPVTLTWLFRAEPQRNPTFQVPMLDGEAFTIGTVAATSQKTYKFSGGDKTLDLPFTVDNTDIGGTTYHRLRATFYAAPKKIGKVEVAPASVVSALPVGRADFFGNAPSRLFRATDAAHVLEVKPLPDADRPSGFAGAVGSQFSIQVTASRSVVQLGEPVELAITVKGDQRLDTLSLGRLDGPGGLPKDRFMAPADPPTGELSDDGKTKTFKLTAAVTGPATEIPALAFSYFDPVKGAYQTVHSDPIALSVKGGTMVGAGDVVTATPAKPAQSQTGPQGGGELALVGADLAVSAANVTDDRPLAGWLLWLVVAILYVVPLAVFGVRSWQVRTRGQREEAAEVKQARLAVEQALAVAGRAPARNAAGPLAAAIRGLARALEREVDDGGLLARLETESFAPGATDERLSAELIVKVDALVTRWHGERKTGKAGVPKAVVILAVLMVAPGARAGTGTGTLENARAMYQAGLGENTASAKHAKLQGAAKAFEDLARAEPGKPELLADWGTAALAAGDVASATLAYRRALAIDGANARARKNLAWLRAQQPEQLRPGADSATDTLFFFHPWPRSRRLVVGAGAFAIAVLLVVPWRGRRRRGLTGLALLPFAVWAVMTLSLVLEDRHADDGVVMTTAVLRAADSAGAPAALGEPLPRGAEVTVLERRDTWTRVRVANGTAGWIEAGAVERVAQ